MTPGWWFDERGHAGAEHLEADAVARFDERMAWEPTDEVDRLLEAGLAADDTVVDLGAGTGVFALAVAEYCERVVAVDVSEAMLEAVRAKAEAAGVENVEVVHAGFLRYEHAGPEAAAVFSKDALHHLPDFWKVEALKAVGRTLEPGGRFRLRDFVYTFAPDASVDAIDTWLDGHRRNAAFSDEELDRHVREEYSTYGFLLEAMLVAAGFEVVGAEAVEPWYASYDCRWRGESA